METKRQSEKMQAQLPSSNINKVNNMSENSVKIKQKNARIAVVNMIKDGARFWKIMQKLQETEPFR